jgi:hypothetical protein
LQAFAVLHKTIGIFLFSATIRNAEHFLGAKSTGEWQQIGSTDLAESVFAEKG